MQALSCIAANSSYAFVMPANMGRPTERKRTAFGERLVAAREEAGLSQRELADKLAITQRALSWWEREPVALRPEQVAQLAAALGVSTDFLLGVPTSKKRGAGPTGKARRAFEAVSKLPRHHQQKIVDVVETFVAGHQGDNGN
jgi:transcriptional regulator with XRE-family HTH domain